MTAERMIEVRVPLFRGDGEDAGWVEARGQFPVGRPAEGRCSVRWYDTASGREISCHSPAGCWGYLQQGILYITEEGETYPDMTDADYDTLPPDPDPHVCWYRCDTGYAADVVDGRLVDTDVYLG